MTTVAYFPANDSRSAIYVCIPPSRPPPAPPPPLSRFHFFFGEGQICSQSCICRGVSLSGDTDLTQTLEHLARLSSMLMRHPLAFLDAAKRNVKFPQKPDI